MAYIKRDIKVWKGNTGIVGSARGFAVRVHDSEGVAIVPDIARFKVSGAAIDKDSETGDVLINQTLTVDGVVKDGCTVVPFSTEETRLIIRHNYELEHVYGTEQTCEYYGVISASGGVNND